LIALRGAVWFGYSETPDGVDEMPNVMSVKEAEYNACFNEYQLIRVAFYAGKVSPAEFIAARNKMEAAMAGWQQEIGN
jgi:hypothetical protein